MSDDTHLIVFQPSGRQARVPPGAALLDVARSLGVDIDSICGGRQTCGKCKIHVEGGSFAKYAIESRMEHLTPAGAEERDFFARHPDGDGRLACAARVCGDLVVNVPPESRVHKQVIRKAAGDRAIEIDPVVRQVYLEVAPHALGERDGDWERLQQALERERGLRGLRIDLPALRQLGPALEAGKHRVTVTIRAEAEVIDVRPGYAEGIYGLAVDIGSTTIAAHLCDLSSGAVLATESMMNPQVSFGEDLMSRVSYAMLHDDGLEKMRLAVIGGLNRLAGMAAASAGLRATDIIEIVVVGNTVMQHILLGLDPTPLGGAPFTLATHAPLDIKTRDLGLKLHPCATLHSMALEAGHVGSDNVAVLLAEGPDRQDEIMLVIDVGTNAEILLGNRERLLSCSSPTGPAFEGAQISHGQRAAPGAIERVRIDRTNGRARFRVIGREAWSNELPDTEVGATGICGSGIIEAVAELLLAGIVRPDGRFASDEELRARFGEHVDTWLRRDGAKVEYLLATPAQSTTGRAICVTQDDVRNIQLAKGALYAGCKLLMKRRGVEHVDRIVLAGAFGSYIDPLHAMALGLIPDCAPERVAAVGNAAGDGARIALLNAAQRAAAAQAARRVEYIETAIDPDFQAEFVGAMHMPHMTDTFPHLEALGMLPPQRNAPRERRSRRGRE
jgi:uncharacterized 2Fe-2S/4Fe-4S cluster protein (DUF4445 family)